MKKIAVRTILTVILCAAALLTLAVPCFAASSAKASVSASKSKVTVGDKLNVTVKYESSAEIGSYDFILEYDASILKYESGSDSTGGNGKLRFANYNENSDLKSFSRTVSFTALNAGSVKISTSTNAIVDNATFTLMSVTEASRTVTVEPKPTASTDNKLKSLSISSAKLSPDFSSSVTEYSASVDFAVKKLAVSAVASDSKAKVSVSDTDLKLGENRITVTVTAESGAKKNYVLKITRLKSELADVTAEVNGWICSFGYDPETLTPPQGFESASGSYDGKNVLTYRDAAGVYTLVWLKPVSPAQPAPGSSAASSSPAGSSAADPRQTSPAQTSEGTADTEAPAEGWYLMEKDGFYPYTDLANGSLRYVPLPLPAGIDPGEGAGKTVLELDGKTLDAYRDGYCLENGLYLIYARRSDGKEDLFFYSEDSGVFCDRIPPQTVTVTVTVTAAPASTEPATEAMATASRNDRADRDLFRIVAAVTTVIAIALTVALIVSSRKNAARIEALERRAQGRPHRRASREIPEHFNQRADSGKIPDNGDSGSEGIGDVFSDDDRD